MSNELIAALAGSLVGAIFTGIASYIIFFLSDNRRLKKKKTFFAKAIIDDLKRPIVLYDRISNDWSKTGQIWFEHTIELKESRKLYRRYEDHVLQFSDELRDALFKYYVKSSKLVNLLEIQQSRLSNLVLEYQKLLQGLKQARPAATDQEIQETALIIMSLEDQETAAIKASLPKEIDELKDHKSEATILIEKLKSECS